MASTTEAKSRDNKSRKQNERRRGKRKKLGRREDDDGLPDGSARHILIPSINSFKKQGIYDRIFLKILKVAILRKFATQIFLNL
jgi:hypothetical protein